MATSLEDLPLRVRKVKIVGNNRTRPYVVEDQLQVWFLRVVWEQSAPPLRHGSDTNTWRGCLCFPKGLGVNVA